MLLQNKCEVSKKKIFSAPKFAVISIVILQRQIAGLAHDLLLQPVTLKSTVL